MDLPVNDFKRALRTGRRQIGLWSTLSSNYVVELVAGAGFDWLLIDTEHSPNELPMVLSQLQAVAPYRTHPVVRVAWNDMVTIKRYLDIGAQTLLIPYVQDAEETKRAVAHTRYPPEGLRGVGGATRANRFGRVTNYAERASDELCVLVQVETRSALDRVDDIAGVEGVDGVFIGPADLHASLGHAGQTAHPDVKPLIDDAIRRIRRAGKAAGILTTDEADAQRWLELGCQFVAVGVDAAILARECDALRKRFQEQP